MTSCEEGVFLELLGLYFVVERKGDQIKKASFSHHPKGSMSSELEEKIRSLLKNGDLGKLIDLLDLTGLTEFQRSVLKMVITIPRGQTMTYGQIAQKLGRPGAARAVGMALKSNPFPLIIPCHRVVASRGLGGYSSGLDLKKRLLDLERSQSE